MSFAESLAAKNQGSTLEMRIEQAKALKMPPPRTGVEAKAAWRYISGAFARQAAGNAFVVLGKCVRPTNTWDTTEFPNLKANKAMKMEEPAVFMGCRWARGELSEEFEDRWQGVVWLGFYGVERLRSRV
jgi:hypothetical protein